MESTAPPESLTPAEVIAAVQALCSGPFFPQPPELLTTNRSGAFEAAWHRDTQGSWVPVEPEPFALRTYLRMRLGNLVKAYARHPGADYRLLTRNEEFPLSLELLVPAPDSA